MPRLTQAVCLGGLRELVELDLGRLDGAGDIELGDALHELVAVRGAVGEEVQDQERQDAGAAQSVRALVEELGREHRQVILFGEVYGSKIQSFHYGLHGVVGFRAFDLLLDGHYQDWPTFLEICARYGVETVPVLASIAFELSEIKRFSEGRTQLMAQDAHIREGVVVRPERERHDPRIGRVILKYVSDSYLFGEKSDFTDL